MPFYCVSQKFISEKSTNPGFFIIFSSFNSWINHPSLKYMAVLEQLSLNACFIFNVEKF